MENYWREVVSGKRRGIIAAAVKTFLTLISIPYGIVIRWRNIAYNRGWKKVHRIPKSCIISVGNIVVGGSGKTPLVIALAEALNDGKVAILSRGYRSQAEKQPTSVVVSQNSGSMAVGDEPLLMASRLPKAMVIVGCNRYRSALMGVEAGYSTMLLDDGMQHRSLARDFDIATLSADEPLDDGHLFPRGTLRESPESLTRATFVAITHVRDAEHYQEARRKVARYTDAPTAGMQLKVSGVYPLDGEISLEVGGLEVGIFCSIAKPQNFVDTVTSLKANVIAKQFYADHESISNEALLSFAENCKELGATMLICTEKDKVKLDSAMALPLPIAWIKVDVEVTQDVENWERLLSDMRRT